MRRLGSDPSVRSTLDSPTRNLTGSSKSSGSGLPPTIEEVDDASIGRAEQSNSSVVYGEDAILKLYRRVLPGIHPDVEIGAFLSARAFAHAPRLEAHLRAPRAAGLRPRTAGPRHRGETGAYGCDRW